MRSNYITKGLQPVRQLTSAMKWRLLVELWCTETKLVQQSKEQERSKVAPHHTCKKVRIRFPRQEILVAEDKNHPGGVQIHFDGARMVV